MITADLRAECDFDSTTVNVTAKTDSGRAFLQSFTGSIVPPIAIVIRKSFFGELCSKAKAAGCSIL